MAAPTAEPSANDILVFGNGVSLALAGETLLVKDKTQAKRHQNNVCGVPLGSAPSDFSIPTYNILWAEAAGQALAIDYAEPTSKTQLRPTKLNYPLNELPRDVVDKWVETLLARAYGTAQRRKRAKVLVNPHAGPGGADNIWEHDVKPLFKAARMSLDVIRTSFSREAIDLCEQLDIDAYDVVIPCSGDGLPYEVFNGLGRRPDARKALQQLAVAHIPCGSGNAMSINLNGTHRPNLAALAVIKGVKTPMDLMSITQGSNRMLSFLSQSVGIIAEADLGTEHLRWLGAKRFDVGVAQRIFGKKVYPCDISVKVEIQSKGGVKAHYKRDRTAEDFSQRKEGQISKGSSSTGESTSSEADAGEGLPPLRFGTVNDKIPEDWETGSHDKLGNFYCGNMAWMAPNANFFSAACANDGLMDLVINDGDIAALKYMGLMMSVETNKFFDNSLISYRKIVAYRFTPREQKDGYISIDGERVPFEPFQVEVHQGLATVLSKSGRYATPGPLGWEK
ncbi:Uu.00g007730.m01.CDS01 [Anthostomella pinea]|uniref:Uu.00g007730.m01.CDS01 n=1 Tax=Anthostomella pinea TaxID=933095 RepID=A0AAI8VX19_9PEZI|nr:Uu.00g007730.m01.CDS01 [Anthostomella pinea]